MGNKIGVVGEERMRLKNSAPKILKVDKKSTKTENQVSDLVLQCLYGMHAKVCFQTWLPVE